VKVWLLGIVCIVVAACVPAVVEQPAREVTDSTDVAARATSAPTPGESVSGAVDATSTITPTVLTFDGNGDTFLAHIETALQQRDEPVSHRFVTVAGPDGARWQGELARYDDQTLLFLQTAQVGGTSALQFQLPPSTDEAFLASLTLPPQDRTQVRSPYPTVAFVRAHLSEAGERADRWRFDVTIRYPDTGWEDYADGWHVETEDGAIVGTRVLLHPHVGEQPFTRSLSGVEIPQDLTTVYIRGHDLQSGYSPDRVAVPLGEAVATDTYEVIR